MSGAFLGHRDHEITVFSIHEGVPAELLPLTFGGLKGLIERVLQETILKGKGDQKPEY